MCYNLKNMDSNYVYLDTVAPKSMFMFGNCPTHKMSDEHVYIKSGQMHWAS